MTNYKDNNTLAKQ